MVYKTAWKSGACITADAEKVSAEIQSIGVSATPEQIVKKATAKRSELNKCFVWDDTAAGKLYRIQQARHIAASIIIYEEPEKEDTEPEYIVRAFENVKVNGGRAYVAIEDVMSDEEQRAEVFAGIMSAIKALGKKIESYEKMFPE